MKDLLGYFLIAQAIMMGLIIQTIYALSTSITDAAFYVVTQGGDVGTEAPTYIWPLLFVIIGLGIFLIAKKK